MQYSQSPGDALRRLPGRLFLDSSTLQVLQRYGEFIYDGGSISTADKIFSVPNGAFNLEALRQIMFVGQRAMFQLVLSENSLEEVVASGCPVYLSWALELLEYWRCMLNAYADAAGGPFSGRGQCLARKIRERQFGHLSCKDRDLLSDALTLECDVFITMDRKLAKMASSIERETGLSVLEPTQYWELLRPWAALFV